jgi:hypothetical protein
MNIKRMPKSEWLARINGSRSWLRLNAGSNISRCSRAGLQRNAAKMQYTYRTAMPIETARRCLAISLHRPVRIYSDQPSRWSW